MCGSSNVHGLATAVKALKNKDQGTKANDLTLFFALLRLSKGALSHTHPESYAAMLVVVLNIAQQADFVR